MGSENTHEIARKKLEKYGEQFLSMFDDSGSAADQDEKANGATCLQSDESTRGSVEEEELASTSGSEESEVEEERRHRSSKQAPVVVFDGGTATRTPMTAKRDRRNFLSPKVADVMRAGGRSRGGADSDEEELLQSAEFQKMAREVELLGAAHLDKREKKKWEARALQQMGAKPAKSPRMPLMIGAGMERKRKEREAKAFEEDVASGMVRIKGMGAAKKRAARNGKRKEGDRGLKASDGTFRGGVLYIKKETANPVRGGRSGKRKSMGDDLEGDSRKRAKKGPAAKKGKKKSKKRR